MCLYVLDPPVGTGRGRVDQVLRNRGRCAVGARRAKYTRGSEAGVGSTARPAGDAGSREYELLGDRRWTDQSTIYLHLHITLLLLVMCKNYFTH